MENILAWFVCLGGTALLCIFFSLLIYFRRNSARTVALAWPLAIPLFLVGSISKLEQYGDVSDKGLIMALSGITSLVFVAIVLKIVGQLPPSN